ncbi:hypothetical protein Dsin_026272 [Dipteronia sinensis]|uniref:Uncharacterized protein n=1 Tax=Dipteronia sinensis TaxID=43782 RepID=A0AAD9ZXB5_9ROSI|nr:hypothetical protein Dsin_026272 [Dipteronia sinensis]
MGPIYIFKEPIGPERMAHLASRGGDVPPSFGHGAGLPWLAINEHVQKMAEEISLLDSEIGGHIHISITLAAKGAILFRCFSFWCCMVRRPAEVLGQVHVAT